jgi:hypothetical protein
VTISRFIDESQPGRVECLLVDVLGRTWKFHEKVPIVSSEDLWTDSEYPRQGSIACTILAREADAEGREVVTIDTKNPWAIEGPDGTTVFEVFAAQLEGDAAGN